MRVLLSLMLAATVVVPAAAQPLEYRSKGGVEFRAQADTGGVARAKQLLAADPKNVDLIIKLGLAQSAIREYREAIETFTAGMKVDPKNALLYRWRGHRYISIGAFDKALADLERGNRLDTTNYDIWYHLGVAHYERGEFAASSDAFMHAVAHAPNPNEVAGATDWLWMSSMRARRPAEAAKALAAITDSLKVTTATAYWQRLKVYRGVIKPEEALTAADTAAVQVATISYGVGNWYLVRGDRAAARNWFKRAVESRGWPGFAFLAAERELAR